MHIDIETRMRRAGLGVFAAAALIIAACVTRASFAQGSHVAQEEPIVPIPAAPAADPAKLALGERLFRDKRLSRDGTRSCASCHDLQSNGASGKAHDAALDGSPLAFNTNTLFNAALSFRLGWRGDFRTLESQAAATLRNPQIMATDPEQVVVKLSDDPALAREFRSAYGRELDVAGLLDALATFERSLVTPASRFDRWLAGDVDALSRQEQAGYRLFKSLGCVSCHQGVNVGGNMYQRPGIFRALVPGAPALLRVPSLRNVADTAPYFHDGSVPTLEEAVRRMGLAQLNARLTDEQISSLVEYLRTLSGEYDGQGVRSSR